MSVTGLTMTKHDRFPVTLRSLLQRLNRALAKENRIVKAPRGRPTRVTVVAAGPYFVVDLKRGEMVASGVTLQRLEKMAREAGVLADWEEVER